MPDMEYLSEEAELTNVARIDVSSSCRFKVEFRLEDLVVGTRFGDQKGQPLVEWSPYRPLTGTFQLVITNRETQSCDFYITYWLGDTVDAIISKMELQ
jgi:hypothetical protein